MGTSGKFVIEQHKKAKESAKAQSGEVVRANIKQVKFEQVNLEPVKPKALKVKPLNLEPVKVNPVDKISRSSTKEDIANYESRLAKINVDDYKKANTLSLQGEEIKFCVVIPAHNSAKYIPQTLNSVFTQDYHNWKIVYIDDASNDGTKQAIQNIEKNILYNKFKYIEHGERMRSASYSFHQAANKYCKDNDVMVHLDGDDMLSGPTVLSNLAYIYKNTDTWITYGTYIRTDGDGARGAEGYSLNQINDHIDNVRNKGWITSHLRTSYTWLFKKIKIEDLKYDGEFVHSANDMAMMFPMLEMAGSKRSTYVNDVNYIYRLHESNTHELHAVEQKSMDKYIRTLPKYSLLPEVEKEMEINNPIPKVIHRIWMAFDPNNLELPEKYKKNDIILKNLHPDWRFIEWDDKKVLNFVHTYYPDFYKTYISYPEPVMRHDSSRYLILKHFGGVFIQHSFVFQKNISPLLNNYELVFSAKLDSKKLKMPEREGELANNWMASVPNHPFWDKLINNLIKVAANPPKKGDFVMGVTGPFILTNTLKEYQKEKHDASINVLDYKYLMPFYASERADPSIKDACVNTIDSKKCFSIFPEAYAYTPWNADWSKDSYKQAKIDLKMLEVTDATPTSNYFNQTINQVYVINLDSAISRKQEVTNRLNEAEIKYTIFPATDGRAVKIINLETKEEFLGKDLKGGNKKITKNILYKITCDPEEINPTVLEYKGYSRFGATVSAGEIGIICSFLRVLKDAKNNNYQKFIIFEDDILPGVNFKQNLNRVIQHAPEDYDITFLGLNVRSGKESLVKINNYINGFTNHAYAHGSYAMLLNAKVIDKMISKDYFSFPLDNFFWCAGTGEMDVSQFNDIGDECSRNAGILEIYASSIKLLHFLTLNDEDSITAMGRIGEL